MERDRDIRRRVRRALGLLAILVGVAIAVIGAAGDRLGADRFFSVGDDRVGSAAWEGGMRFVWREQGRLEGETPLEADDRAPALDRRRGDLYFARRTEHAGWDLFRARRLGAGWGRPEPLFELNSPTDDLDPLVVTDDGALIFASRRPGGSGGLDLWRAERDGEGFAAPVNLGPGLNSAGDDRHPTLDAAGVDLVFASNRLAEDGLRYELYHCRREGDGYDAPRPLEALAAAAPSETRSPALSADGRFLYFASDRPGGAGGFDLWRAVRLKGEWGEPRLLDGVNSAADEVDPALSPEGTRLVFARTRAEDPEGLRTALELAERREIVAIDRPGGLAHRLLTVLVAILVTLLATWLYLKWQSLHPFVKFLIISLIIHLLLLLMADPGETEATAPGSGDGRAVRVTFLASESESESAPSAARGDAVAAERREVAEALPAEAAARSATEAPSAPEARASAPSAAAPRREASAAAESAAEQSDAALPAAGEATARENRAAPAGRTCRPARRGRRGGAVRGGRG
ncbi:MAG: hypothetical protein R3F20_02915 [Planctomycetota bacterium]